MGKAPQSLEVPQSLDCGALQDGTLSGIASKWGAHGRDKRGARYAVLISAAEAR